MKFFKKLSRSVKGRVAIITGAGSGMGEATAKVFAAEGVKVIATDIKLDEVERVSEEIQSANGECLPLLLDVTDKSAIEECIKKCVKNFNGLDFVINNAGISSVTAVDDENYENYWDDTLSVVLTGQIKLIRAALPHLLASDNGRIVNISSTEGFGASPFHSPYTAAKHGVIGLTRSLALELGPQGITVNCICPGPINTNMTAAIDSKDKETYARRRVGLKRYGEPEEVAHATLNLCLPSSSYINGVYLPVDGGLSIRRA
jgi:3-oxoacyl-[acyl-carrier protein] reductase|tara:strand:- start:11923 stop:12702 length:780 start_codon:yes stop_codon:yes gene_type:complete